MNEEPLAAPAPLRLAEPAVPAVGAPEPPITALVRMKLPVPFEARLVDDPVVPEVPEVPDDVLPVLPAVPVAAPAPGIRHPVTTTFSFVLPL
jgi:hypothetical protein